MTTGLVIFSRLDSSRLPGKALLPFAGRALLGHVIDRVRLARRVDRVIVATSDRKTDTPIATFATAEGVAVFRGSVHDVLGRAVACARECGLDRLIRVCGDSPFMDPTLIDRMVGVHLDEGPEMTTNLFPRSFPAGMSIEVIETTALERGAAATDNPAHREHVTTYFYEHAESFRILNVDSRVENPAKTPLTVDTADDLVQANWLARHLSDPSYGMEEVLALARQWRHMHPVEKYP